MNVLVLALFAPALALQTPDTQPPPPPPPNPDRYTIDVVAVVREGTARTLSEVLSSRVPGLLVIPGSGLKGSGAGIRFAGVRSFVADAPPLILLDGFRIDSREDDSQLSLGGPGPSRLDDIQIEDVQSIEVLRGPASAAYGPGSAAGVILIRTKESRTGPPRVEGFVQGAVRSVPTRWPTNYAGVDLDNATPNYRTGCTLALQADGQCVQDFVQRFNPLAERNPFATAPQRQLGLSATAGRSWGSFRISGTLDGDAAAYSVPAVTWADDARQWNLRVSGTLHPARTVDIVTTAARMSSRLQLPMYGPVQDALLGPADSNGFTWAPFFQDHGTQDLDRTQIGVQVRARPLAWLGLQALFGRDDDTHHELKVIPGQTRTTGKRQGANHTFGLNATAQNIAWRGMRFTTTLGLERLTNRDETNFRQIYPDTATSCGLGSPVPCSFFSQRIARRVNSLGVYGMEQIGIRDRLFVTAALRHDAYDDIKLWSATHPSLTVDWIARREQPGTLGRLALRAAYGSADQPLPDLTETFVIAPFSLPVPPLVPERTREFELSGEASGLGGKWRAQVSLYDARSGAIQRVSISGPSGYATGYASGAELSNRGIAAAVSANLVDRAVWGWDVQLSFWGNRNRLVKQVSPPSLYGDAFAPAQGEFTGYPANGYWGRPITSFSDLNGDGILAANEVATAAGFAWMGTPYPTQGAALNSSWRVMRHWRVSATLDYRAGQTLFNQTANMRCQYALCRGRIDRTAPLAEQATALAAYNLPLGYYEDADYLKLRELALTFDVPDRVAAALGARAASVMIGGRDLFTWTRYSGPDPEAGSYGRHYDGSPTIVGDFATVPLPASWTLRVRVSY